MKVASYVRVSTMQQVQTQTIEQQLERLQQYVSQQGWSWQPENIFRDDGYSGSTLKRSALDQLRDRVASAYFDIVLITTPDRLARKYVHQMLLVEEFEKAGCQLIFLDQPMSDDPNDQLLLQIRGAVAEYERTLITERMRRGRLYKYQTGQLLPWTQAPYGYLSDPDKPRNPEGVQLEEAQAAIVGEIFARYLAPEGTLSSVARWLTAADIPSPTGLAYWRPQSIRNILRNPVYKGTVYAGRTKIRPIEKRRSPLAPTGKRLNNGLPTPPEEWILVGHVPAIVSPELFEQVQVKLSQNKRFASRNNKAHTYLLRALVSCGLCHGACCGQTRRRYTYYACAGKGPLIQTGRNERCPSRLIPMKQLDDVVWRDLCWLLTHPEAIAQALERAQSGEWLPQELQARHKNLQSACQSLHRQIERLTDAYLVGTLKLAEYQRRRQELEKRIAGLEQQSRELAIQTNRQAKIAGWVKNIETFCQQVRNGLEKATFTEKRQLLRLLIDRIVVTNEDVEIRYVFPLNKRAENTLFYLLHQDYC